MSSLEQLRESLKTVYDPELNVNIVDLGLIYELSAEKGIVYVTMTLTTPGCPMHDSIVSGVKRCLLQLPDVVDAQVELVWEPRWSPELMSQEAKAQLS